jgi:hypothetical protein
MEFLSARDGIEAVELYRRLKNKSALVVLDIRGCFGLFDCSHAQPVHLKLDSVDPAERVEQLEQLKMATEMATQEGQLSVST